MGNAVQNESVKIGAAAPRLAGTANRAHRTSVVATMKGAEPSESRRR